MDLNNGKIYTGASGLVLPVPNKLHYPPEFQDKTRLAYYASLFNSIEINSSFYKLPNRQTLKKWAESVPDYFRFTFKLWKQITHNKQLSFNDEDVFEFFDRIAAAGDRKGCVLVQFPPGLTVSAAPQCENLLQALTAANAAQQWPIAVEFRNKSWYEEEIEMMIGSMNASIVLHDIPASATPLPSDPPETVYLRFHGPEGRYRGSYSEDFLSEYAGYVNEWQQEGSRIFVYFNNTMGDAVNNLITFNRFLSE